MKIGINGTGIMTRCMIKLVEQEPEFQKLEIVHINGRSMTLEMFKDRLLFSTAQGHSDLDVAVDENKNELIVNGKRIKYTQESNPELIPWDSTVELIFETTGKFRDDSKEGNNPKRHFKSAAKNLKGVIISAPGKGSIQDFMVAGSPDLKNDLQKILKTGEQFVIGAASCTTTATIPIIDTLDDAFGIESCFLTTVHAATRSQDTLDGSKCWSAFDTQYYTTGATKATNKVLKKSIPMDGIAYRTSDKAGSFIQIDAVLKQKVSKEAVLKAFKESKYAKYIAYSSVTNPPSSYIRGDHNMVMIVPEQLVVINENRVIVKGLYDNEEGYTAHFFRLIKYLISLMK